MTTTTASQTIGPYWHLLEDKTWADLTRFGATGQEIIFEGHIHDGEGARITDACVEIFQTSPPPAQNFPGFGRAATDDQGKFSFKTLMPAPVPGPGNTLQAPHLAVTIFARGLMIHVNTRCYFEGTPENENDPILNLIPEPRRATLIAGNTGPHIWHLDFYLQGAQETVFFEI
jgi:protocatechuate 3,4-dioxygenase alpha subunit